MATALTMNTRLVIKTASVALVAVTAFSNPLFAQDFGWIQTSAPANVGFLSVASSADGTKLLAVGDETWISTNSGMNWTQTSATNKYWYCVASSADGTKLVGIETDVELVDGSWGNGIYTSTNFGASWTPTTAPIMNWGAVASSADGTKLVAVTDGGYITTTNGGIYTSSDSGNSWTKQTAAPTVAEGAAAEIPNWQGVASSADGTKLAAASFVGVYNGIGIGIWTSTNSGATWAYSSAPVTDWYSIASSSNGMTLVAICGGLYASTNSGVNWTPTSVSTIATLGDGGPAVASSYDGTRLVAVTDGGGIYTSTNSGTTWMQQANQPNTEWRAVASSADGTKLVALALNGGIWIGQYMPQITEQPQSILSCPGDPAVVLTVAAGGTLPLNYQWQKNGTNLVDGGNVMGSATTNLTLLNLSQSDTANYDVVITNAVGSVTSSVVAVNVNIRPAEATPVVVNGFIVGATLTDGGCGYTNPPAIVFSGLGGTGATAYAQISDGSVTNVVITDTGSGYPANAVALIAPPLYPVLSIVQTLTNTPSAAAIPVVTNGFIVGAILTASGRGYTTNPAVSFSDASGHGAAAYSQISNGTVTNIVITSTGSGYSTNAVINIAPTPTISVVIPSANNLMLEQNYQLQIANGLTDWTDFGAAFSATNPAWTPTNFWNVAATNQIFFRLQMFQ
jgi:hypothetical protein